MEDPRKDVPDRLMDTWLQDKRQIGDPPADKLIHELVDQGGLPAARQLFDRLIRTVELPSRDLPLILQDFIQQERTAWPEWASDNDLTLAQDLFVDHGPKLLLLLYFQSLPILYACKNGAQVLVRTGRLAHDPEALETFSRRIAETGQFLLEVMAPRALRQNGPALDYILKIRLIHAAIRHFIQTDDRWDSASWGEPINQEDMAITLLTFGRTPIQGLEKWGVEVTLQEREAYWHSWKVAGHFLGVQPDLLDVDPDYLLRRIMDRQVAPSAEGALLTQALIAFGERHLPAKELRTSTQGLLRFCLTEDLIHALDIPKQEGCLSRFVPHILKAVFGLEEKLEERSEPLRVVMELLSRRLMKRMVGVFNDYKDRPFHVPPELVKKWSL